MDGVLLLGDGSVFPGKGFGDTRAAKIKTLVLADAEVLAGQSYAAGTTPTVTTSSSVRRGAVEASAQVNGVGAEYFTVKGTKLQSGRFFDVTAERTMSQEAVIDENARSTLFDHDEDPLGKVILVGASEVYEARCRHCHQVPGRRTNGG